MLFQVISGQNKFPNWDLLWSDFTQEELTFNFVNSISSSGKGQKVKEEKRMSL